LECSSVCAPSVEKWSLYKEKKILLIEEDTMWKNGGWVRVICRGMASYFCFSFNQALEKLV